MQFRETYEIYNTFNSQMREWSNELEVTPEKIEEFCFGYEVNEINRDNNPRHQMISICKEYITTILNN